MYAKILICIVACVSCVAASQSIKTNFDIESSYPELEKPTIVVFKSKDCFPCKLHATTVIALRDRHYRVRVYDVKEHRELFEYFKGYRIPYTALLKNGKVEHDWIGIQGWRNIARETDASYKLE